MAKQDAVSAAKSAIISGQDSALEAGLEALYDQAALDQKASDGSFQQSDIDKAVAAAIAPLNQQISDLQAKDAADLQAASDAKAKSDSDMAALQQSLVDLQAKEQLEEQAVADVKAKIDQVQASFDAIKALFNPPPPPAPAA